MGKTFEALNRAEEQRRVRLNEPSAGANGFSERKLTPVVANDLNWIEEQKLKQAKEVADELGKMVSGLIDSIKKSIGQEPAT